MTARITMWIRTTCHSRWRAASRSRKPWKQAKPTLLEPVMEVEITVPDEFAGSIMGDLNSRRGRIQGMDNKGGNTVVKAEVPDGRDADLRRRPDFDDAGPRQLQHGNASLRRRAAVVPGQDCREGQGGAWRCEGRGRIASVFRRY